MTEFTPLSATLGGMLIGASAVLLLWLNGRIAGISGILYGAFSRQAAERNWRLAFVAGLVLAGWTYSTLITGTPLVTRSGFPVPVLILAGLLVGAGTRLGSGCTSGHGVCGISRLSVRSITATGAFLAAGILTATLARMLIGGLP